MVKFKSPRLGSRVDLFGDDDRASLDHSYLIPMVEIWLHRASSHQHGAMEPPKFLHVPSDGLKTTWMHVEWNNH